MREYSMILTQYNISVCHILVVATMTEPVIKHSVLHGSLGT